jgi:peptidoglycan/LPS O-acetylase OafA/YrhL
VGTVDALRALAALSVLACHAYALGGRVIPVRAQHVYDVPLITLATGVWLFFAISGYVISRPFVMALARGKPLPALGGYSVRRALRIFPLYWVALTAVIAIAGNGGAKAWQLAVHCLLLNNLVPGRQASLFSVAWTLTLEVLFYISVPLLASILHRRRELDAERLAALVVCSWLLSTAFTAIADLQGDGEIGLWLRGSFLAMWQMFCPGILLALAPELRRRSWARALVELPGHRRAWAAAAVLLVCGAVLGAAAPLRFGVVPYHLLVDSSRPLFALGYGAVLAAAIRRPRLGSSWLLELGLVSYGIYLLHAVLLTFLLSPHGRALVPLPYDGLGAFAVHVAFLTALTIPLAIVSWRWLELPLIRVGRALGAGRPSGH